MRIPNPHFNNFLPHSESNIRYNMTAAFQTIFDNQPSLKDTTQDIIDYLNSDGDTKPLENFRFWPEYL